MIFYVNDVHHIPQQQEYDLVVHILANWEISRVQKPESLRRTLLEGGDDCKDSSAGLWEMVLDNGSIHNMLDKVTQLHRKCTLLNTKDGGLPKRDNITASNFSWCLVRWDKEQNFKYKEALWIAGGVMNINLNFKQEHVCSCLWMGTHQF